jgi:hypothetical protein
VQRPDTGRRFIQLAVLAISLALLVWGIAGLIANPDFSTGSHATSVQVLGVDMNGWHALSGILLTLGGLIAARRAKWAFWFALYAVAALGTTAVWALLDSEPAGLFPFQHQYSDAVLHFAFAGLYGGAALIHWARVRPALSAAD